MRLLVSKTLSVHYVMTDIVRYIGYDPSTENQPEMRKNVILAHVAETNMCPAEQNVFSKHNTNFLRIFLICHLTFDKIVLY